MLKLLNRATDTHLAVISILAVAESSVKQPLNSVKLQRPTEALLRTPSMHYFSMGTLWVPHVFELGRTDMTNGMMLWFVYKVR